MRQRERRVRSSLEVSLPGALQSRNGRGSPFNGLEHLEDRGCYHDEGGRKIQELACLTAF